jgi:hypothetical protein
LASEMAKLQPIRTTKDVAGNAPAAAAAAVMDAAAAATGQPVASGGAVAGSLTRWVHADLCCCKAAKRACIA